MELRSEKNGTNLVVALIGELNTLSADKLDDFLQDELNGVTDLELDFTECEFISSSGIRVLLATYRKLDETGGKMKLSHVGEDIMDVLKVTSLDTIFNVNV